MIAPCTSILLLWTSEPNERPHLWKSLAFRPDQDQLHPGTTGWHASLWSMGSAYRHYLRKGSAQPCLSESGGKIEGKSSGTFKPAGCYILGKHTVGNIHQYVDICSFRFYSHSLISPLWVGSSRSAGPCCRNTQPHPSRFTGCEIVIF